jgi:hypothetical protein
MTNGVSNGAPEKSTKSDFHAAGGNETAAKTSPFTSRVNGSELAANLERNAGLVAATP